MIDIDNETLIRNMIETGALNTERIIKAFREIDRANFIPEAFKRNAYDDEPLPIGPGQTISQPSTVAFMLELLNPQEGEKILDIGSGSGWTTALLAYIVGMSGSVTGVEIVPELVEFGKENIRKYEFPQAKIVQAGNKIGYPEEAPFDKILVSAASESFPVTMLCKNCSSISLPIQTSIFKFEKTGDRMLQTEYPGFRFVPLK